MYECEIEILKNKIRKLEDQNNPTDSFLSIVKELTSVKQFCRLLNQKCIKYDIDLTMSKQVCMKYEQEIKDHKKK